MSSMYYTYFGYYDSYGKRAGIRSRSSSVVQDKTIGNKLQEVRKALALTQEELAEKLGVTRLSVARYEAGRVPRINILRQMARMGGISIGALLSHEVERVSPGPTPIDAVPQTLVKLLHRLRREIQRINRLPSPALRRHYDRRAATILSRAIRDLEDYRSLLATRRGRRSTRDRETVLSSARHRKSTRRRRVVRVEQPERN
jgi:transcriptional regulator with XRE-family HTH domain